MGIGIHTGRVIVGNIGSLRRTKYAAVGSNMNLAGRVESFSTGGQVLITEATRTRIAAPLRIDGEFQVEPKGVARSLLLFEIGGIGQPFALSLPFRSTPLRALAEPLPVQFTVLEEKFLGHSVQDGHLIELSDFETRLSSSHALAVFSDLRITVAPTSQGNPAGGIYGKVVEATAGTPGLVLLLGFVSSSVCSSSWRACACVCSRSSRVWTLRARISRLSAMRGSSSSTSAVSFAADGRNAASSMTPRGALLGHERPRDHGRRRR